MSGIHDFIDNEIKSNDVVLFMKGTPQFPQCGFSGQVVQILDYIGVDYKGINVLADSVKMDIPFFNTGLLGSKRFLDKEETKVLNFLRAYLEAIKVLKTEREYSIKALAQFTRVQNLKAVQEGYDYFVKQLEPVPFPSVGAMQAVVDQIAETNPKARGIDAKSYVTDKYLKRLEDEGFVKKIWGK